MLQPEHNNRDVKVINDLIDDLTRLETRERIPLGHMMSRVHNNNNDRTQGHERSNANMLTKQSSLLSSGSRGSGHESVIIDAHSERVSRDFLFYFMKVCLKGTQNFMASSMCKFH